MLLLARQSAQRRPKLPLARGPARRQSRRRAPGADLSLHLRAMLPPLQRAPAKRFKYPFPFHGALLTVIVGVIGNSAIAL